MVVDDGATPPVAVEHVEASVADTPETPDAPDELALARELVLKAHPETVQELVAGHSLAELLASVPAAEAAYARIAQATRGATNPAATVPGGGAVRSAAVNVEGLGPLAKIRAGLSQS